MDQRGAQVVSAEVILRSETGRSLARSDVAITAVNVEEFTPAVETIAKATSHFRKLGFKVDRGDLTLTLSGSPSLFEKVFKVRLALEEVDATESAPGGVIVSSNGELVVPESLKDAVEEVVFPERPEFFKY